VAGTGDAALLGRHSILNLPPLHITIGHNGGPPLDDGFKWGDAPIATYYAWKRAHTEVWKAIPYNTMVRRVKLAEALGLTYEEYTLEILFNGRYLQSEDGTRIADIKAARR
jgi:hypothetical protein